MKSEYLKNDLEQLAIALADYGLSGSTIMVTGATGLLGSLCVKAMIQHNRQYGNAVSVIALARSEEKVREVFADEYDGRNAIPYVSFVYQDINVEIDNSLNCDYIIHTAAPTVSKAFITRPVEVLDSIYSGTRAVLQYAAEQRVKGMVFLSSMEAFGQVSTEKRLSEEELGYIDLGSVRSCYSEGKRVAELLCACYAREYGVPVRIARLAQTFGAGVSRTENRVFAQFARSALAGEDIVLHTAGRSVGNYCYTADSVSAIFMLLAVGENGEAYTIVNESTTRTIKELAELAAEVLSGGRSKVVMDIPKDADFGYAPETALRLSANKICDLGWEPNVNLEEMFRRMLPDLF